MALKLGINIEKFKIIEHLHENGHLLNILLCIIVKKTQNPDKFFTSLPLPSYFSEMIRGVSFLLSLTHVMLEKVLFFWSNFRNEDFDGFTRYEDT